jgi:hypothetical protein
LSEDHGYEIVKTHDAWMNYLPTFELVTEVKLINDYLLMGGRPELPS